MTQNYTGLGTIWNQGEGHVLIPLYSPFSVQQGRWGAVNSGSYPMYTAFSNNNSHIINDQLTYQVWLSPGTYTYVEYVNTGADHGINTVYVDGSSVGTCDHYSGGNVFGVRFTIASIAITTPGLHTLSFKIASKHTSSSNYYCYFISVAMYRTA